MLEDYEKSEYYPFHMPGHKRNTELLKMGNPYGLDITEIHGFDNLHMADGILKEKMETTARLYGARRTFFMVNGSTGAILAAVNACTRHGDKIVMARNCHRSVYHSLLINELAPVYIYPQQVNDWGIHGPVLPEDVDKCLKEHPDAAMVVVTSPTYEGIISDIRAIAAITHKWGIPLMVDEAHGAHLGFHSYFPPNSISQGADIVIHSVHKTLPAFTQTALLHVNGSLVSEKRIETCSAIYQTSSPSYLLMTGIENSLEFLRGDGSWFEAYKELLVEFYGKAERLTHIRVLGEEICHKSGLVKDPSKLVISVKGTNITGHKLNQLLREQYHLEMEAENMDYVIGMTSIADKREGLLRLWEALFEIDRELVTNKNMQVFNNGGDGSIYPRFLSALTPYEADSAQGMDVPIEESCGCIAKESIFLYPPGIPIVMPGEIITKDLEAFINHCGAQGLSVKGLARPGWIEVAKTGKFI